MQIQTEDCQYIFNLFNTMILTSTSYYICNYHKHHFYMDYFILNFAMIFLYNIGYIVYKLYKNHQIEKLNKELLNESFSEESSECSNSDAIDFAVPSFSLGERMKSYETIDNIVGYQSFVIRIDGRRFSRFTKYFKKPFDENFMRLMQDTAIALFKEFQPTIVHVQSDEISMVFKNRCSYEKFVEEPHQHEHLFSGRVEKLLSISSSYATSKFCYYLKQMLEINIDDYSDLRTDFNNGKVSISFDSRVVIIPENKEYELVNYLYWRSVNDGYRNAVSMIARKYFSSKQLDSMSTQERINQLKNINDDYDSLPEHYKYGWFIKNQLSIKTNLNNPNDGIIRKMPCVKTFEIVYSDELKDELLGQYWKE